MLFMVFPPLTSLNMAMLAACPSRHASPSPAWSVSGLQRSRAPGGGPGGRHSFGVFTACAVSRLRRRAAESPFAIEAVPGKGLGAVASRDIRQGELVVSERPPITFVELPDWEAKIQQQFDAPSANVLQKWP